MFKVLFQQLRHTLAFERHVPVEDFTDVDSFMGIKYHEPKMGEGA